MTPPQKGSDFPRGRGGLICLIFQCGGGGVHHREIFPEGSHDTKESDKEKTQNSLQQFICEDLKHEES